MKTSILITGTHGTICKHLCSLLQKDKLIFKVLERDTEKAKRLQANGIQTITADCDNSKQVLRSLHGVDTLILLPVTSVVQAELQCKLINQAKRSGVSDIIKLSTFGRPSDLSTELSRFQTLTQDAIKNSGKRWTLLHAHSFMQDIFSSMKTIREKGAIFSPNAFQKYSPVDARDIAEVTYQVLSHKGHEGKTYIISGPEVVSMKDIAHTMELTLDREVRCIPMQEEDFKENMPSMSLPTSHIQNMKELNALLSRGKATTISPHFKEITGRRATSLREFLQDHSKFLA